MGKTHAQRYMPELLGHIGNGKLKPDAIISHRPALDEPLRGDEMFGKNQDDCRKVLITPRGPLLP